MRASTTRQIQGAAKMTGRVRVLAREADAVVQPVRPFPPNSISSGMTRNPDSGRETGLGFWMVDRASWLFNYFGLKYIRNFI
jgi:hypothetical protein